MRHELTDYEWAAIKPFLPNKPRGVPRVNDWRVLNGIFWVLRSGAPWRQRGAWANIPISEQHCSRFQAGQQREDKTVVMRLASGQCDTNRQPTAWI